MLRQTAILAMAFGAIFCCGCGDSPTPAVAVRSSAPPKPAPPPAGLPGEPEAKPGVEAPPVQLGGPQIRRLLGSTVAADPTTSATAAGPSPSPTVTQPSTSPETSAPAESPAAATPPAASGPAPSNPTDGSRSRGPSRRRSPAPASDAATPPADPSTPTAGPPATDPSTPASGPNVERAQVGVGAQGKDYGNADGGYISEPISTYFTIRENIAFNIQIPNAMKFFKQLKGRNPKSLEEYMKEIVKENGINLPELPEGSKYVYDAKAGELMVARPPKK
jgi:hypothetical protein